MLLIALYSAYKRRGRAEVFNNAAHVSASVFVARGRCDSECVARRSVRKHFAFHFLSEERFQEHVPLVEIWRRTSNADRFKMKTTAGVRITRGK